MAILRRRELPLSVVAALLLLLLAGRAAADDASSDDHGHDASPGCSNKFQLVKVKNWVNGTQGTTVVGLSARFGATLPRTVNEAQRTFAVLTNPLDCCSNTTSKLTNSIALATRGGCPFTAKAEFAQVAGAAGLLIINDDEELYKMVCGDNDTSINVTIPVIMIPHSAGKNLKYSLDHGARVEMQLYSPSRPVVGGSLNYYSAFILVKSSQHIAKKVGREALNYGHFSKRICEMSDIKWLRNHSKLVMIIVDMTILLYQLGMCAVAILFISENLTHLFGHLIGGEKHHQMIIFASITLSTILVTNCFTNMRVIYFFAMVSSVFLAVGAVVIIQYTVRQPNHWTELPAYTSFTDFLFMIGQLIYAFEGQTMVLPVENKVRNHETFLAPCGILTITFGICSLFMQFLGFIGYTTYGAETGVTITENVPNDGFYNTVTICLIMQSILGNGMAMYVIFDLFENGFKTKFGKIFPRFPIKVAAKMFRIFFVFVTYLMVLIVPHLDIMCSLVGVTTGTLCALIYPPIFELICFWDDWKKADSSFCRSLKLIRNVAMVSLGIFFIVGGVYANTLEFIKAAKKDHLLDFVSATQSYNETLLLN